jgi:hypothetical protein
MRPDVRAVWDVHPNADLNQHADDHSNIHGHPDRYEHPNWNQHADGYSDPNRHGYANGYANPNDYTNLNQHADRDPFRHAHGARLERLLSVRRCGQRLRRSAAGCAGWLRTLRDRGERRL